MARRCLTCCGSLVVLVVALLLFQVLKYGSVSEAVMEVYVPSLPTEFMVDFALDITTFVICTAIPSLRHAGIMGPALQCRAPGNQERATTPLWVLVVPSKGGIVLGAHIVAEISARCGLCPAISLRQHKTAERARRFWPASELAPPTYNSDMVVASVRMTKWPHYARTQVSPEHIKCVVLTRDPLSRIRSYHTYSMSDGDFDLRPLGKIMRKQSAKDALDTMWNTMGRDDVARTHAFLMEAFGEGCVQVYFEGISDNFNATITKMFDVWGVNPAAYEELLDIAVAHDLNRLDKQQIVDRKHVSFSKFSKEYMQDLHAALVEHTEIMATVRKHRMQLNYDVETGRPLHT